MRIVRYRVGPNTPPRIGILTPVGIMDAISCWEVYCLHNDIDPEPLPEDVQTIFGIDAERSRQLAVASLWVLDEGPNPTLLFHPAKVTLLPPVAHPPKILCVGLNYRDHCREQGHEIPDSPVVFSKLPTALCAPRQTIMRPRITRTLDFEAELAVVIGRGGRHIREADAMSHIAGFSCLNDVTARELQKKDGQWTRAKSCDTFAPFGPAIVTPDEIPDPQNLTIRSRVNGKVMQDSNTSHMIFPIARLIAFISEFATLETGDIIATGTPPGIGHARKPPVYLKPGDEVLVEIEKVGILENRVQDEP